MKILRFLLPVSVLTTGLLLNTAPGLAKAEYTKKEKKACTACHVKMPVKDKADTQTLNDVGKCYEKAKSLEGCAAKK